ncbi:hypothetical protein V1264_005184 [Littorina saxatilis]|uniref:Uncharacterized protein n=1 Tax=Littorina saxatilis TaxID=31220 RepID=A0AAN9AZA6_9CAEN
MDTVSGSAIEDDPCPLRPGLTPATLGSTNKKLFREAVRVPQVKTLKTTVQDCFLEACDKRKRQRAMEEPS